VAPDCADAALLTGGFVNVASTRLAPYVDFGLFPATQPFLERLSRNSRHQLRRSNRQYSEAGALVLRRAETVETGLEFLSDLIRLHNITWHARGKPGAFATPAVRRFYQALIAAGVPNREVDMLQVTAADSVVGYLMNFRHCGIVSAYQSGFNYAGASQHQKPGLTCHFLAIEAYRAEGIKVYDFLAGADRYKLSLANAQRWLHWLTVAPRWQARTISTWLRRLLPA
jgi:CelD/BcsL family acetyltransferase involved in cellulose biosynthesis